jgi:hypothetical protein
MRAAATCWVLAADNAFHVPLGALQLLATLLDHCRAAVQVVFLYPACSRCRTNVPCRCHRLALSRSVLPAVTFKVRPDILPDPMHHCWTSNPPPPVVLQTPICRADTPCTITHCAPQGGLLESLGPSGADASADGLASSTLSTASGVLIASACSASVCSIEGVPELSPDNNGRGARACRCTRSGAVLHAAMTRLLQAANAFL